MLSEVTSFITTSQQYSRCDETQTSNLIGQRKFIHECSGSRRSPGTTLLRKRKSLIMQIMRSIFHYRLPYKGYLMNNSVAYSFYGMMWPRFSTTHFTTFTLISSKQTFSNIQLSSVRQIDWHVACCRFTAFSVYNIQYRLF
jgi:hypothetical protein